MFLWIHTVNDSAKWKPLNEELIVRCTHLSQWATHHFLQNTCWRVWKVKCWGVFGNVSCLFQSLDSRKCQLKCRSEPQLVSDVLFPQWQENFPLMLEYKDRIKYKNKLIVKRTLSSSDNKLSFNHHRYPDALLTNTLSRPQTFVYLCQTSSTDPTRLYCATCCLTKRSQSVIETSTSSQTIDTSAPDPAAHWHWSYSNLSCH